MQSSAHQPPIDARVRVPLPSHVEPTSEFRSTWLSSSIRALRERDLWNAYLEILPAEFHEVVETHVAGMWLPMEVAMAHYEACDALPLGATEMYEIGAEVCTRVHGTLLGVVVKMAKSAGANPWMALERTPRLWDRIWVGGALALYELGPKEAQLEVHGWPAARYQYTRNAIRGVLHGVVSLFCRRAYVRERTAFCDHDRLVWRISWV